MPFIKVTAIIDDRDTEQYVNSDKVSRVHSYPDFARFVFAPNDDIKVTLNSAAYFLACVEAQAAHTEQVPEAPSLKSRIAQALHYDFQYGARLEFLRPLFPKANDDDITSALTELEAERVAIRRGVFYFHASNPNAKTFKPNPSLSIEAADLNLTPAENNETT